LFSLEKITFYGGSVKNAEFDETFVDALSSLAASTSGWIAGSFESVLTIAHR
jgi:hypothetical protein